MIQLTCKKCKRTWNYKGKSNYYATCPQCHNNVKTKSMKDENDERMNEEKWKKT